MAKSFSTDAIACFIARRDQLQKALPTWRTPLTAPEESLPLHPFTGEPTRDPDPSADAVQPERLAFEHVALPGLEDWEQHYLALDLALSDEPGLPQEVWDDFDACISAMKKRGLLEEPFYGGDPADCGWIHVVPPRLVHKLADLGDDALAATRARWTALSPLGAHGPELEALRTLARKALSTRKEMFLWLIHPTYRVDADE